MSISESPPSSASDAAFRLSPTVEQALNRIPPDAKISASAFAQTVLSLYDHSKEYAAGKLAAVTLTDGGERRPAKEWLAEIQSLFDTKRIRDMSSDPNEQPELHGRIVILGLALLDSELLLQLEEVGAFTALIGELREPLLKILSERGQALYRKAVETIKARPSPTRKPVEPPDGVFNWGDDPMKSPGEDLLGRAAFARFLAARIIAIPSDAGAYALHLYGPWGAGKSTILNFLCKELANTNEWLVIDFNAWRNQHIQPPWWSLMERVFANAKKNLSWKDRWSEQWWRLTTGRVAYIFSFIVVAWSLALIVFPLLRSQAPETSLLHLLAANFEDISKILALVATIWGASLAFNRSLLLGSAHAAQNYAELSHDPMDGIKSRFEHLIKQLKPKRVAIFVDDLDRCQSSYVIELLEGIQTLFRETPVVFVVAADRCWLNACYEQVYEKLKPQIHEIGKPLGTLFLEKAFRFSTPMPGIPEELKEKYWQYLLFRKPVGLEADLAAVRGQARNLVSQAQSEGRLRELVDSSSEQPFPKQRAIREEAAVKLATPEIVERLEHTLRPYAELLEPNPRAMKRLVNTYSANLALAFLSETTIERHQLVLWTILSSRWPALADYLAENPALVTLIGQESAEVQDDELKVMFTDDDVIKVAHGGSMQIPLTAETVGACARMWA